MDPNDPIEVEYRRNMRHVTILGWIGALIVFGTFAGVVIVELWRSHHGIL